jgi:hypothetical protein
MPNQVILLSAILVAGPCRERAQRVVDALCSQTQVDSIEIVILDLVSDSTPQLQTVPGVRTTYIKLPEIESWGKARAEGTRRASSAVVAFIEDHCYPAPDWAEALIEAHKGPWAAVGYAFTSANPQDYMGRVGLIVDYGPWMHPVQRGPSRLLPGNNVSYKRDLLLEFGEQLDTILCPDFIACEIFNKRGLPMFVESQALAAHEFYISLSDALQSNHTYCRLLAANRVHAQSWGKLKRIVYGIGTPLGAPTIKIARLLHSLRERRSLWRAFVTALPVLLPVYFWSAVGESLGYLFGQGSAEQDFNWYELKAKRT